MSSDQFYRFYSPEEGGYLKQDRNGTVVDKAQAGIFTLSEFNQWGKALGYEPEEVKTDQEMVQIGAPKLPGF